jgi:hypothetical protein
MTLLELKEIIDHAIETDLKHKKSIVYIPNNKKGTVGGTPCTEVYLAGLGFDWDQGKFMLYPEKSMVEMTLKDKLENL